MRAFVDDSPLLRRDVDALRSQMGGIEARFVRDLPADGLWDAEFRVFSQFGEDGIIQFLVQRVAIENQIFVEFGVQDYSESNTRFLLTHDNWRGLILDGDNAHVTFARATGLDWQYGLDALRAFVDRENINGLLRDAGIEGDIGLLSIDIDGNDYWVLEQIDAVSARILIVEYNSTWGPEAAVTVPYAPDFERARAHPSNLYWGASLAALTRLADHRGYALVGGNSAGNNAFFVRRDVLGEIPEQSVAAVYRPSRFRESLDCGQRSYVSDIRERLELLAQLSLWDLDAADLVTVSDRYDV